MAIDTVFVSPGMLPPTISTTPNSPSVCAKVSTAAVSTPGHASGSSMRVKIRHGDMPQHAAAARTSSGMASNARCIGWIANGRFTSSDATSRPAKLNASVWPVAATNARPSGDSPPKATSR